MATNVGIKSLAERLSTLEEQLKTSKTDLSDIILASIENKKRQKEHSEIKAMEQHFHKGIQSNTLVPCRDFLKILEYSIKWIENNIAKLAKLMNIPVTSELKHDICISLLKSVDLGVKDSVIETSITYLVVILFPHEEPVPTPPPRPHLPEISRPVNLEPVTVVAKPISQKNKRLFLSLRRKK